MIVYVALLRDIELSCDEVLCVRTDKKSIMSVISDYYGLDNDEYEYCGYTDLNNGEYWDEVQGYHTVRDILSNIHERIYVIEKSLNYE